MTYTGLSTSTSTAVWRAICEIAIGLGYDVHVITRASRELFGRTPQRFSRVTTSCL